MPTTAIVAQARLGSRRKSLKPIAPPHCLSITATQNEGSEYSRKDRKMIR